MAAGIRGVIQGVMAPPSAPRPTTGRSRETPTPPWSPASPYFPGARLRIDRWRFLLGSVAAAGAASTLSRSAGAVPLGAVEHEVPPDASKTQGYPLDDESYGSRSQFETEVRTRFKTATSQSSWTFTPLQKSTGIITPSSLHFERSHGRTAVTHPINHLL